MAIFQSLKDEDVKWRALSMIPDEILYRCGDLDWVPLLRIWTAVGYASLLLGLDIDVQKLEAAKMRKGKNKAEEDLNKIQEEKNRADHWERKFQDTRVREDTIKGELLECQVEKTRLKARVAELERSLHQHRSHNSMTELKVSRSKNEELKRKVEELEAALQN
ncbi:hypothetical protein Goarm_022981 [Gossypium armourianum]|uniref:Uncharacterized protein n=1 Tax=Gossypium armourianum TaxID=34283 RepID=A0A7J9KFN2_9ROSI|nr:hypothetical protein [Gossypium armourianum]